MKANIFKIDGFIYVTSDEILNKRDYSIGYKFPDKPIGIIENKYGDEITILDDKGNKHGLSINDSKKIISTNNTNLPIQQLTEEEVAYCEVNEFVEFEKKYKTPLGDIVDTCYDNEVLFYKLLIPKDQETIEQLYDKFDLTQVRKMTINTRAYFEAGAKSQQPIIDQLKRENEKLIECLECCVPDAEINSVFYNTINHIKQQLIQKHNG